MKFNFILEKLDLLHTGTITDISIGSSRRELRNRSVGYESLEKRVFHVLLL